MRTPARRPDRRSMRIAFFVNRFPMLSEQFILNQITGLIDRGHDVDVHATLPGDAAGLHADVAAYRLLERTRFRHASPGRPGLQDLLEFP